MSLSKFSMLLAVFPPPLELKFIQLPFRSVLDHLHGLPRRKRVRCYDNCFLKSRNFYAQPLPHIHRKGGQRILLPFLNERYPLNGSHYVPPAAAGARPALLLSQFSLLKRVVFMGVARHISRDPILKTHRHHEFFLIHIFGKRILG